MLVACGLVVWVVVVPLGFLLQLRGFCECVSVWSYVCFMWVLFAFAKHQLVAILHSSMWSSICTFFSAQIHTNK